jgi:predicted NAD-dependent protein-ADP-ribosyltransferase YbiA (DUF1768 family)
LHGSEYGFLALFHPTSHRWENIEFYSAGHHLFYLKMIHADKPGIAERILEDPLPTDRNWDIAKRVRALTMPNSNPAAKMADNGPNGRIAWEAKKKDVMLEVMRAKFNDAHRRDALLATHPATLVEEGANADTRHLADAMMQVRKEMREAGATE